LKNNKQKSENKIQKYTKHEKNNVLPLTRATLIKKDLHFGEGGGVIFEQALQKRMCAL
jgi:hypothetical protein